MNKLPRLRTALAVVALTAGSLGAALLGQASKAGAVGGATVVVQTMDSCSQVQGSAVYSLTGGGVSMSATTPSGGGSLSGSGCPVPKGSCSAGPCASFTGVPPGTYRIVTTKTPPANSSNPEGYAPCEGGSACRSQVADVTVSGSSVSAVVTNVYPNNKVTTFSFAGTSSDPIVFHDFGLAAPGSGGNAQCDGDSDADDHSTGSPSGSCAFTPESAEATACQPFPWSCGLGAGGAGAPPPPATRRLTVAVPATVGAFTATPVTVTAMNGTATDPTFQGTVTLTSTSDPLAALPAAYTFTAADAGVHNFTVTFRHPGAQVLSASGGSKKKATIGAGTGTATVTGDDASFVEDLYHDILGRLGADGEVAYWTGQIAKGEPRQAVAAFFSTSPEVYGRNVDAAYQQLAGHAADAGGRAYWVSQLGGAGYDEGLLAALASTASYYSGHGKGTDRGFVTALYQDLLGRTPRADEVTGWLSGGAVTDRGAMARAFAFSHEHHLAVVAASTGWYQHYLGRPADSDGAQYWATQLDHGTHDEAGVANFTSLDEYYGKAVAY